MEGTLEKDLKEMKGRSRSFSASTLLLLALLFSAHAVAQPGQPVTQSLTTQEDRIPRDAVLSKVSSDLLKMRAVSRGLAAGQFLKGAMPETENWLTYQDGDPLLEFRLNTTDDTRVNDVVSRLKSFGCSVTGVYPKYGRITGTCDLNLLDQIAANDDISTIYPVYKPIHNKMGPLPKSSIEPKDSPVVNGVDNSADVLMKSDLVRSIYNVNGSGTKVGIISDSFDSASTGMVSGSGCLRAVTGTWSQKSGNLSSPVFVLLDYAGGDNEGRAMAELVYDVAPGATLMFYTANINGEAGFATAIDTLGSCGANIIVDDVTYFSEPMFQDGIIAQAAGAAVNSGVSYFSSAGNAGPYGVFAQFSDNGSDYHDFGSGNTKGKISLKNNSELTVVMQWNDPYSGTYGPGASRDLDLYLVDDNNNLLASSTNIQGCSASSPSGDPLEILGYQNTTGSSQDTYLQVKYKCGNRTSLNFRIVPFSRNEEPNFDATIFNGPTIFGHSMANGAVAVAAMNVASQTLEPFTALGGNLPIYFSPTGTPVSQTRITPFVTAPDGVNTTVPGFAPFLGTSAAAPNAAAVGALVLSYQLMAPPALTTLLTTAATAIGSPGWHPLSGYGLVNALSAFQSITIPGAAALVSPMGAITNITPEYVWNAVASATYYQLYVDDSSGTKIQKWYTSAQAGCSSGTGMCSITPSVALAEGSGIWWIQTWNSSGYGPWSGVSFTVVSPDLPGKSILISPPGGTRTNTPFFTWNAVSTASWYYLWVDDASGHRMDEWYKGAEAGCSSGTGTCSVRPDIALAQGPAKWWVQAWNSNGYGPWSDGMPFTSPAPVLPGKTILFLPSGAISTNKPSYVWNADPYATWYYLWVDDSTGTRIQKWIETADTGCSGGADACAFTPDIDLAPGSAKWWIQTWNPNGSGPWSDGMAFTVTQGF
jgi:hypothetical protein